jgi:hypothetical protein
MPWSVVVMVVMIVLITALSKVSKAKYEAMGRVGGRADGSEVKSADAIASESEIRQLKERIAVLERVVTDNHGSISLDRQIEQLRDR